MKVPTTITRVCALITLAIGLMGLAGWIFDVPLLKSMLPNYVAMKTNAALGFMLLGLSLLFVQKENGADCARALGRGCALASIIIGGLTLFQMVTGLDLGIDQLLFTEAAGALGTRRPNQMAFQSAVNFILKGVAILWLDWETGRGHRPAQYLSLVSAIFPLQALIAYAYGVKSLFGLGSYTLVTQMAVHTAMGWFAISIGTLFARPHAGMMALVTGNTYAGYNIRRLLPPILIIPPVLGWFVVHGYRLQFFDPGFGISVLVLASLLFLSFLVWQTSSGLNSLEQERGKTEAELRASQEGQRINELKNQFFANVSHELRTPLTLILGPTQKLLTSPAMAAGAADLEVIHRNATLLHKHVNDLLDVAKLEAGRMSAAYAEFDLVSLVRQTAANFDSLATEKQIAFTITTPGSMVVQADADKIQRVFMNLLSNAFKFTPTPGAISIQVEDDPASPEMVTLTVNDSGPGIREDLRESVFDRFFQAEESSTRKYGGTGLGLSIAKEFVELHAGVITAGKATLGGARFTIRLPKLAPPSAVVTRKPLKLVITSPAVVPPPVTVSSVFEHKVQSEELPLVLVVEDNDDMRRFLSEILEPYYRCVVAVDGVDGLEKATVLTPDLIISDLMMPRMNGADLLKELRKIPALNLTPFVMLTAKADEELRVTLLDSGAQDYLIKPFIPRELLVRAKSLIVVKRARVLLQSELEIKHEDIDYLARELSLRRKELQKALATTTTARDEALGAESQLKKTLGELSTANEELRRFAFIATHDLKEPLRTVSNYVQLLKKRFGHELGPDGELFIRYTVESTQRMYSLIDGIVSFSKADEPAENEEDVGLEGLVGDIVTDYSLLIRESGTIVKWETLPSVMVNRESLRHVLQNLIENAIKYRGAEPPVVTVAAEESDEGEVTLSVSDNGLGIDPIHFDRIFIFLQRLHTADKYPGNGVGLTICKKLIERWGGKIWLDSKRGSGSTFHFTIPTRDKIGTGLLRRKQSLSANANRSLN